MGGYNECMTNQNEIIECIVATYSRITFEDMIYARDSMMIYGANIDDAIDDFISFIIARAFDESFERIDDECNIEIDSIEINRMINDQETFDVIWNSLSNAMHNRVSQMNVEKNSFLMHS